MDPVCHCCCIKLFTLFYLLYWSWCATSSAADPLLQTPSTAVLAAQSLTARGYSLFGSLLVSVSSVTPNFSGTLLAPPDFAFSSAASNILNNRRYPPRPSVSLVLYHAIRPPPILSWAALSSTAADANEFHTFHKNNCLYLFRNPPTGEVTISSSPLNTPLESVKIHRPDLYVDDRLTVHGIDGVLDPSYATKCSTLEKDPTATGHRRTFLDRTIKALTQKGYNAVALAMAIRRSELRSLKFATIFAVSDKNLFLSPDGFHYDFRHHVLPKRYRLADLARIPAVGTELATLAQDKTVQISAVNGAVRVDGVLASAKEVYHNRKIVVISVSRSLDDAVNSQRKPPTASDAVSDRVVPLSIPFPACAPARDDLENGSMDRSIPGDEGTDGYAPGSVNTTVVDPPRAPAKPPKTDDVAETCCDLNAVEMLWSGGGDVNCPLSTGRGLRETEGSGRAHVGASRPSDVLAQLQKVRMGEVNIADDLFFYI